MQKVREKAMLLQDMHQLWCEKEKDTVSCWFAKHFKTGEEKRINNVGKDLLILKGMVHVVIVKTESQGLCT